MADSCVRCHYLEMGTLTVRPMRRHPVNSRQDMALLFRSIHPQDKDLYTSYMMNFEWPYVPF